MSRKSSKRSGKSSKSKKSQSHAGTSSKKKTTSSARAEQTPQPSTMNTVPPAVVIINAVLLLVAITSCCMLVWAHFNETSLPGCGPDSGCSDVVNGPWGKVPGIDWPVSFIGLAYFLGLLVTWLMSRGKLSPSVRWLIRLGGLGSLGFVGIMLAGKICNYCLTIHIANFVFIALLELTVPFKQSTATPPLKPALAMLGITFLAINLAMVPLELTRQQKIDTEQTKKTNQDIEGIIAGGTEPEENTPAVVTLDPPQIDTGPKAHVDPNHPFKERTFIGRYPRGPEEAPIRIVLFTDYQCKFCQNFEKQLLAILRERDDIQASIKHYPYCTDCNAYVNKTDHANACWAARAAEAAGILKGAQGFWTMHEALFERKGTFTSNQQLAELAAKIGVDFRTFHQTMGSDETLERVRQDTDDGRALGLTYTPMIFINGKQMRIVGTEKRNILSNVIDTLTQANLPPKTAEHDIPLVSKEKFLEDWQEAKNVTFPPTNRVWSDVDPNAPVRVVMYVDYGSKATPDMYALVKEAIAKHTNTSFAIRQFPFDQECNSFMPRTFYESSCQAARAVEAAGQVGGKESFWAMHEWLLNQRGVFSEGFAQRAAEELGLDLQQFNEALESPTTDHGIQQDILSTRAIGLEGVPALYINERRLIRWKAPDDSFDILQAILELAAEEQ